MRSAKILHSTLIENVKKHPVRIMHRFSKTKDQIVLDVLIGKTMQLELIVWLTTA